MLNKLSKITNRNDTTQQSRRKRTRQSTSNRKFLEL